MAKIKAENIHACFNCFTTADLAIMPYKHEGKLISLIFICKKCHPKIKDKKMRVILELITKENNKMKLDEILKLVSDLIKLEKKIETEIRKEKNARKRKKLLKALKKCDSDTFRNILFK